jgi:hypothetical protein
VTDDLPRDPDERFVPSDLRILAGLAERDNAQVTVIDEDGVGPAQLVIVPSLFRHACGMEVGED